MWSFRVPVEVTPFVTGTDSCGIQGLFHSAKSIEGWEIGFILASSGTGIGSAHHAVRSAVQ